MPVDHLTHYAETRGDHTAIVDDRPGVDVRSMDFAAFNDEINRLANALSSLGLAPGEHVAWWGQNSLEAMASIHACRKAGATSVPIPYRSTPDEAHYLLENAEVAAVVVESAYAPLLAELAPRLPALRHVIVFGGDVAAGQMGWREVCVDERTPATEGTVQETRTMIYTSGTTGLPKGAVRLTGGAVGAPPPLMSHLGWPDMERLWFLTTGPLYHSGPSGFALRAQALGGTVVTQHSFDAEDWLRLVDAHDVTATFSAPTPIRRICALPDEVKARYDVSSLESTVANAAPWTMTLKRAYLRDFREDSLWEVYGSTELSVVTALAPADQLRKPGSCGQAAPGVEVKLFDDAGTEVIDPGVPGELYARSAALFETYHNAHDRYLDDHRD
ncbi:MAG: AMP-binding protein, partial [Actinomycetota bacterium]